MGWAGTRNGELLRRAVAAGPRMSASLLGEEDGSIGADSQGNSRMRRRSGAEMRTRKPPETKLPAGAGSQSAVEEPPQAVVHSDPEIMGGTPVFVGTRVPVDTLFDYLEGDYDLEEFLDDFPSVEREQALATLEIAREAVVRASARPDR
jgi:uncharacterized protein (DUF433 family)